MVKERLLDVRGLEPPQPLERALEEAAALVGGERVRMIHHREPCLLYPLLTKRGFCHRAAASGEEYFELLIWRKGDTIAENAP